MAKIIDAHFADEAKPFTVEPGKTIEEIVRACDIPEGIWLNVVIILNGTEVVRDEWSNVFPVESDVLSIHVVPLGGGDGKSILRLVAVVAIAIAAPALGASLAKSAIGTTLGLSAGVAQAGITIIGTLAVNALIPPPTIRPNVPGGSATSNAYFLSGQSNRARPYEIVPVTYGMHRLFANLASAPHIFSAGTSSIFQAVYDWGVGSYELNDVVIGETPWWMFKNRSMNNFFFEPNPYTASATSAFKPVDLEIYNFPLKSVDLAVGLNELGDGGVSRTVDTCHTAVVELTYPSGLAYFNDVGDTESNYVKYRIGYKGAGDTDFGPIPANSKGYAGDAHISFTGISPGGPDDDPDYNAVIRPGSRAFEPGQRLRVYVRFPSPAYPGESYANTDGDPDRPKESFKWTHLNTGNSYVCSSTYGATGYPEQWNPAEWAYHQTPTPESGYTVKEETGPHAGTMYKTEPFPGTTEYAFDFIAPTVEGSYKLEMDINEWWDRPYTNADGSVNLDAERCADVPTLIEWTIGVAVNAKTVIPDGQQYSTDIPFTYIKRAVYGEDINTGPWIEKPNQVYMVWFEGSAYTYATEQHAYVRSKILGAQMFQSANEPGFNGYDSYQYMAVITNGAYDLIAQDVLKLNVSPPDDPTKPDGPGDGFEQRSTRFININDDWFDDDSWNSNTDQYGTLFSVYGSKATPAKISIVIPMPSVGAYDIRVERVDDRKTSGTVTPPPWTPPPPGGEVDPQRITRNDDEEPDSRYIDASTWTRLASRGLPDDKAVLDLQHRHTLSEMEFEANQSIQGNVQEVSALLRSRLRTWKGGSWRTLTLTDHDGEECHDNPAWIALDILTGYCIQNKRAPRFAGDHCGWLTPEQIDLQSFYDFSVHCNHEVTYQSSAGTATRKRYTINMVMASDAPIIETVQNILGQCRAQLIINQAGKLSVMLDEARTTPRQLFTPSNSWDFSGSRSFTEIPHCFNVQFMAPELGWQTGTVKVYLPGYDATGSGSNQVASVFEDLDTIGITNSHQAQLYGAYMLAQATIRSETFTLSTDVENLVCQRGDLVEVAHDAPLMGGRSAVITGIESGWLHISESFDGLTSDTDTYTLRTSDGSIVYGSVTAISGNEIQIQNQSEAGVGDLIVIGPSNRVTEKYLIQGIRPKPDLTAEITLVKYDARVYQVDDGQFPVWSPNFNQNISGKGIHSVQNMTGKSTLVYAERQPLTESVINWGVSPDNDSVSGFYIEMQTSGNARRELDFVAGGTRTYTHRYDSRDTGYGSSVKYYVIPYSSLGFRGTESAITLSKRIDLTPPTVKGFSATFTDSGNTRFTWDDATDPDIEAFSIYYKPDPISPGVGGEKIGQPAYNRTDWVIEGAQEGLYWIVATDTSGNNSDPSVTGSYDVGSYPTPGAVQNFRLWIDQGIGVLRWDLLDDPSIVQYQLRYHEDINFTNGDLAAEYGITSANTNSFPSEKLQGSFFIRAKNRWDVYGPWTRTDSVFEGLAVINASLSQKLRFIGRYPFSDVTLKWSTSGDVSLVDRYRVYFYPTDPADAFTYETPDELVADRPPVLIYEGPDRTVTTTVSTTEDTGRQHGYFLIQVISIYGTPGDEATLDFQVIKDTTPPVPPERFFVNIVSNTNADLSWLQSQSVDVDRYDLRYTPEYSSPRWEAAEHIATVSYNVTGYQTNARTGTYLIRATDTSGNVSDVVMQRTTIAELPDMNVIARVEDAPDWEGKKVYFIKDGSRLLMDGAPYTGGDEFGAEPYRESTYFYHERVDLGRIYETRLTSKLQAYGQLSGSVMADWDTLAEIDPISGVEESADWDCWVEYRTGTQEDVIADWVNMVDQDPISGSVASDWTEWRAFFSADVTARFIDFRIVARAYNPNAEVGVVSGLVEVDMPDRYWTKSDIPVGVAGASVSIDPPFKHLEAVAVTVDGNDYNVRAVVSDKKPSGFDVNLIDQTTGASVPGQIDVFCSGYGIEAPEII